MTTPRTLDAIRQAAERAGEKLYEHRRRAMDAAAKARAPAATQPSRAGSEAPPASGPQDGAAGG